MARRKTTKLSELVEFFFQRIDRRVQFGKEARDVILSWAGKEWKGKNPDGTDRIINSVYTDSNGKKRKKQANTKRLSLLRGLVLEYQVSHLDDLPKKLEKSDDFYVKDVSGNCMCGETFSAEAVLLNVKGGNEAKNRIYGKIKAEKKITARDSAAIGMDCYNGLPTLFEELHIPNNLKQYTENAKKTKEEKLQEIIAGLSPELQKKLETLGLDADTLKTVLGLEHVHELTEGDESGVKFDIDQRNSTNTFNWFRGLEESAVRENIRQEYVEDLLQVWYKLNKAAHLLTDDDLAEIMVYSHEFRQRKTDLLLAGVKQDLIYLSTLDDNHPHIKQYSKVNIDKHFTLPKTKYRNRENLPERTIRDVLEQEFVTRIEAMGVHNHFKDIIERRIAINRETCDRYGVGRTWDYIIQEIEPWFEKNKEELHEDYKKWGEIVREHVFTKEEYTALKYFLKRSRIGQNTQRENYLRNHHIAYFNHVAPEIITIGRKLRQARKLQESGANEEAFDLLKQNYFLAEDFESDFSRCTGLDGVTFAEFSKLAASTAFVEHTDYQKFRKKLLDGLEMKLVPKELIKDTGKDSINAFQRYYKMLSKKKIYNFDDETVKKAEHIKKLCDAGVISKFMLFDMEKLSYKAGDKKLEDLIKSVSKYFDKIDVPDFWKEKTADIAAMQSADVLKLEEGVIRLSWLDTHETKKYLFDKKIKYYVPAEVQKYLEEKQKYIPVPEETVKKLKKLADHKRKYRVDCINTEFHNVYEDSKCLATPETIDLIEKKYIELEDLIEDEAKNEAKTNENRAVHYKLSLFLDKFPEVNKYVTGKYAGYKKEEERPEIEQKDTTALLQEQSLELSVKIRKGIAGLSRKPDYKQRAKDYFFKRLWPELMQDKDVMAFSKGNYVKSMLAGLEDAVAGEKENFTFSESVQEKFKSQKKILEKMQDIVNKALYTVYSIKEQLDFYGRR